MQITFHPSLGDTVHLSASKLSPQASLLFSANLSRSDYDNLSKNGARVELWSDIPFDCEQATGEWRELVFYNLDEQVGHHDGNRSVYFGQDWSTNKDRVTLYASSRLASRLVDSQARTFAFTYRIVYPSGSIQWMGNFGQNSYLTVEEAGNLHPGLVLSSTWSLDAESQSMRWDEQQVPSLSSVGRISNLDDDYHVWALGKHGVAYDYQNAFLVFLLPKFNSKTIGFLPTYALYSGTDHPLSISPKGDIIAAGPGPLTLRCDDLNVDPAILVSDLLGRSHLDSSWRILGQDDRSRTLVLSTVAINPSSSQLPSQLLTIPLLSFVPSLKATELDIPNLLQGRDIASKPNNQAQGIAIYSPLTQETIHVFESESESPDARVEKITFTCGGEGTALICTPVYRLDKGKMGVIVLSPFFNLIDSGYAGGPSKSGVLPTPPPSPRPVDQSTSAHVQIPSLTLDDRPSPAQNSLPEAGYDDSQTESDFAERDERSPTITRRASWLTRGSHRVCPPFGSTLTLFKSLFFSISMIFKFFCRMFYDNRRPGVRLHRVFVKPPFQAGIDVVIKNQDKDKDKDRVTAAGSLDDAEPQDLDISPADDTQTITEEEEEENGNLSNEDQEQDQKIGQSSSLSEETYSRSLSLLQIRVQSGWGPVRTTGYRQSDGTAQTTTPPIAIVVFNTGDIEPEQDKGNNSIQVDAISTSSHRFPDVRFLDDSVFKRSILECHLVKHGSSAASTLPTRLPGSVLEYTLHHWGTTNKETTIRISD